jgi:hypothetical protein
LLDIRAPFDVLVCGRCAASNVHSVVATPAGGKRAFCVLAEPVLLRHVNFE